MRSMEERTMLVLSNREPPAVGNETRYEYTVIGDTVSEAGSAGGLP